jgi:benzoyl-CoA reductase/2-hydroxyglutaryl-CoA dehydratase subunit BcrC/BadD/HgdB
MLSLPHRVSEGAVHWYRDELTLLKEGLEKAFETHITDSDLANAIQEYNHTRQLLKKIYELREAESPSLTGSEALAVVLAALRTPKEQCNRLLARLLSELEAREGVAGYKARLMIAGGACDDPRFMDLIEDCGGLVVADALCFGSRYFWEPVRLTGDPIGDLATTYLGRPFCAGMSGGEHERLDYIMDMVKRFRVDGIIFQRIRWCDLWGGEAFYLGEKLKELGFPLLTLEREYWLGGVEQIRTRVQAFLEIIESRR